MAVLALAIAPSAFAATFTVNSVLDTPDTTPGDGVCAGVDGCTLRAAIQESNAFAGADVIEFTVGLDGSLVTIQPGTPLPTITQPVLLDGWTQGAFAYTGPPLVRLDGSLITGTAAQENGLAVNSPAGSTVRGFSIYSFPDYGLSFTGAGGGTARGNYIGTNDTGADLGNNTGVLVGSNTTLGGPSAIDRNVISGNVLGVYYNGSSGGVIEGNYIGTNIAGTAALPNGSQGIFFDAGLTSTAEVRSNVISGNGSAGLRIQDGAYTILGNLIGVQADGVAPLPNAGDGVAFDSVGNQGTSTIGGLVSGRNTIAFNGGDGIYMPGVSGTLSASTFRGNSIHSNTGLGIDLGAGGVTPNAPSDGIPNWPTITSATQSSGTLNVVGELFGGDALTSVEIDLYTSQTGDGSGNGEGRSYLGTISGLTTNADGFVAFSTSIASTVSNPSVVTATQTQPGRATSEFSNAFTIPGDGVDPTVSLDTPDPGDILRGTVNLAATATDNVAVDRVVFRYDNGPSLIDIATDTTDPYTGTFDSTTQPNTLRGGGTVYAFAYDTSGNETGVGNAVMLDNPPSRIVFETDRPPHAGNSEIYRAEPNGTANELRLTNSAAVDTHPSLSPNGSLVVWQRGSEIWRMNSDGTGQAPLTTGESDSAPSFSPDGTRIVFVRDPIGDASLQTDLFVMNADGTGQTAVMSTPDSETNPSWSPDGTKLAFDSTVTGVRDIYTVNVTGTGLTALPGNSAALDSDPDWSPDGLKLLFVSARGATTSIWRANVDGTGTPQNITNAPIFDADPAWSPDGTHVVFARDEGGATFHLHHAAADGTTAFPPKLTFFGTRNSFPDWALVSSVQAGPTFTVTTADDHADGACSPGDCTLREAIAAANARPNDAAPDVIAFAIPGSGLQTIALTSALPDVDDKVVLDGTTQGGLGVEPPIFLDGAAIPPPCFECVVSGLRIEEGGYGSTIRGLAIGNFSGRGLILVDGSGPTGSLVEATWIGVKPGSALPASNGVGGIRIFSTTNNQIGSTDPADRVIVAANGGPQISIAGALSTGNVVQGSWIGIGPDGNTTYDGGTGVLVDDAASGTTIGGNSELNQGNVVTGFQDSGIAVVDAGTGNVVAGNAIGRTPSGTNLGAPPVGVRVNSPSTDVGDSVSPPGFANPARGNRVFHAATAGVVVGGGSSGTRVAGNEIGGTELENGTGVLVQSNGVAVGPGNTIVRNTGAGVEVNGDIGGVRIVANSMRANGGLGIDLVGGANGDIAAPVVNSATTADGATTVTGTLAGTEGNYFVEFFVSSSCDLSGAGEGTTYLGSTTVSVSAEPGSFTHDVAPQAAGDVITATATSVNTLGTSEFSVCADVTTGATDGVVTLEPVADAYIDSSAPGSNFGSATFMDVYGGFNSSCVPYSAPVYGLLKFDLTSLPPGEIADAKLVLTSRAGYAQDGDPNHHALFIPNDSWTEGTVNFGNRPADGLAPPLGSFRDVSNADYRQSPNALGADFVWRNTCGADFAGDQTKVFPTNSDTVKTLEDARADMVARVMAERDTGSPLSLEIWTPNCDSPAACVGKSYWARYYSRESAQALRPKLVVTYANSVNVTSFSAVPADPRAGVPEVALGDVPPSVLLAPSSRTASTPLGDTPLGDTPLGDTPLGDTPLGDTPLGDTNLGLGDPSLLDELRAVALSSLPLMRQGGWPAVLANTPLASRALQNVNLGEVLALTPRPAVLDGQGTDDIRLEELDFSRSPLGDLAAVAVALGNGVLLSELPGLLQDPELARWCTTTNTTCQGSSVLALGLQGAPLGDTPLGDTPLGDTPLGDTPLGDTPLGDTPLGDTPLGDTPLGDTPLGDTDLMRAPLGDTPLGDTPLGDTDLTRHPLGDTPLGDTPLGDTPLGDTPLGDTLISALGQNCLAIFEPPCPPANDTLDQHFDQLVADVSIADLVAALTNPGSLTLADLVASLSTANLERLTVAQLLAVLSPPGDYTYAQVAAIFLASSGATLDDLLAAVLRATARWETIDVTQAALARVATGGGVTQLQAALTVPVGTTLTFAVDLPVGWTAVEPLSATVEFSEGAVSGIAPLEVVTPAGAGTRHTLRTPFAVAGDVTFRFDVKPGTTLGPASPSLAVTTAGGGSDTAPPAVADVQETFEPNGTVAEAHPLALDRLYLSYITSAADTDYFRYTVPAAGTRTTFHVSHLPADYDLVVYGPPAPPLVAGGSAPALETPVLGDGDGASLTHLTESLPSETLDDLTLLEDRPVLGVSAFRTLEDDEAVVVISDGAPGEYVIQVTGYNGATSVEPYVVRVEQEQARLAPQCQPRLDNVVFPTSRNDVDIASIPADADTVFLANGPQLAALGGQSVLDWFGTQNLTALRNTGHPSALVRLEQDDLVRDAYIAWNQQPCSTARANTVVTAINGVLQSIRAARPSVENVVLLGADTALPFARLSDLTTIANEADYASTFGQADDLYGALYEHRVLSDDPYGTSDPIPYLQRQIFVPQYAVGRLVETPAQITGALDRFVAFGGVLDPQSARTTGYEFLQDGARAVADAFAAITGGAEPPTNPALIGDFWTRGTLAGALTTSTGLIGMNGHADHRRLQPARDANGDGRFEETDLFTAADLPSSLTRAVVFSMGCHSSLSASDASVAGTIASDWPQALAGKGVAAYAGNLGYGYGDTIVAAYSEALNVRLAQGLRDGMAIGEALVEAKQSYLAGLGLVGVYDEKAMAELALYGLPMWSLAGPAGAQAAAATTETAAAQTATSEAAVETSAAVAAAAPPPGVTLNSTDTDPVTGLQRDRYTSQPTLVETPVPGLGRYWSGPSGVQVTHLRPLQPKAQFDVAEDAHGLLITGLASDDRGDNNPPSPPDPPVDPVYARPLVDSSAAEPELPFAEVAFPAKIQTLIQQRTRTGRRISAVLVHGQFFSDDVFDVRGEGVQRLFTRVDADLLRSPSTDYRAPRLGRIEATILDVENLVAFTVDAVDLPGSSATDVKRVLVAFRDETSPVWRFLDLSRGGGSTWGGTAGSTGTRIEYFVQAVDAAGNVAVSTNKGELFSGAPPAAGSGGGVETDVTGARSNGWFTGDAILEIETDDGVVASVSVDGGPYEPYTGPVTITGDGLHTVRVRGSNGYEETLLVPIDTRAPTVALDSPGATVPLNGVVPLRFRCLDTASGIQSCTATLGPTAGPYAPWAQDAPVRNTPLGATYRITVTAIDRVGTQTQQSFDYTVTSRQILYTSSATGSGDIYTLPVNATPSTTPTRLTFTSFPEADPVWAPTGDRIAFSSNRDGTWRIYLMDADGTDVKLLPTGTGDATQPAWSPNGQQIAFVSIRSGNQDIWAVNVNGSNLRRLTTDSKLDVAPAWSPDSSRIAWSNGPGGQLDIYTMNASNGGSVSRLTRTEDLNTEAAWRTGTGNVIVFSRRAKGGPRFEIWTMTSTGSSRGRIISSARNDTQPTWLQNGRVAWSTDRDDTRDFDLFSATSTGGNQLRITNAAGDERGPDG